MRLGKTYTAQRLEAACRRALALGAVSFKSVQSILKSGLDQQPLPATSTQEALPIDHPNIRGGHYYH